MRWSIALWTCIRMIFIDFVAITSQMPTSRYPLGIERDWLGHIMTAMAQGAVIIFDKSTIQTLTVDESVLLDNFYMSNMHSSVLCGVFGTILSGDMQRAKSKGSPESLVGALATRTPDSQACGNVFHTRLLEGELMGTVRCCLRCIFARCEVAASP